jgi:ribonuclease HI
MDLTAPHYTLFSQVDPHGSRGYWRFVLHATDGSPEFEASDVEPGVFGERLELLTIVRALESLDQPSRVTLAGCSESLRNGVRYGLGEWSANGWQWECFGQMVPVKNSDLWQRLERALRFHEVECRTRRIDAAHEPAGPHQGEVAARLARTVGTHIAAGWQAAVTVVGRWPQRWAQRVLASVQRPVIRRWKLPVPESAAS